MHMYISVVTLFVDDVDRTVDFYTKKLGWEVGIGVGPDAAGAGITDRGSETDVGRAGGDDQNCRWIAQGIDQLRVK